MKLRIFPIFLGIQFDMNRQEIFLLWIAIFITVHTTTLEADTILGRYTEIILD